MGFNYLRNSIFGLRAVAIPVLCKSLLTLHDFGTECLRADPGEANSGCITFRQRVREGRPRVREEGNPRVKDWTTLQAHLF